MGNINLEIDDKLKDKLKRRAKKNLRSMANEIRVILNKELGESSNDENTEFVEGLQPSKLFMQ